jgi:hypothetical protein
MDFASERAAESIRSQMPAWLAHKPLAITRVLLNPVNLISFKLWMKSYGSVSKATGRAVVVGSAVFFSLLAIAAIIGFSLATEPGSRLLIAGILSSALAVHILANASPRFRVPWLPLLSVLAAVAIVRVRRLGATTWPTRAATGAALLLFIVLGVGTFVVELPDLWNLRMSDSFR